MSIPVLAGGQFEAGKCRDVKKAPKTEAYILEVPNIYLSAKHSSPLPPHYYQHD